MISPSPLLYIFPYPILSSTSDISAYSQPPVTQLLTVLSFLFLLNIVRVAADHVIYAGIIAEIGLGIIYGEPLAGILQTEWETTFTVLGYLGLIGIVFEGGLSTNLSLLLSNLSLSITCAVVGIALPVAFSFALLMGGYGYTPLEAFAAGAALSSTSLGTTIMVLNNANTSGGYSGGVEVDQKPSQHQAEEITSNPEESHRKPLQESRIGTVLISAAVIDDVIGLVLSSLIPALSAINKSESGTKTNLTWTIIKPLLSSLLIGIITPLIARFVLRPLFWFRGLGERWSAPRRPGELWAWESLQGRLYGTSTASRTDWGTENHADSIKLMLMIFFVSGFAAIAYYTGSSVLFGAYLAGLTLSYMSSVPEAKQTGSHREQDIRENSLSFEAAYGRTIGPLQQYLLAPLFFASIGYAIPFLSLWSPKILWRGIIYAALMCVGKLAAGLPIIIWSAMTTSSREERTSPWPFRLLRRHKQPRGTHTGTVFEMNTTRPQSEPLGPTNRGVDRSITDTITDTPIIPHLSSRLRQAIIPTLFFGTAMVSRGEIGLLIIQIARSGAEGSASTDGFLSDEAFLVSIWAILLCTLIGPIGVGFIMRRWGNKVVGGTWG